MARLKSKNLPAWAGALEHPSEPRNTIHMGRRETGSRVAVKKLPPGFSERLHEHNVLTTFAHAFEHTNKIIEDWEHSL